MVSLQKQIQLFSDPCFILNIIHLKKMQGTCYLVAFCANINAKLKVLFSIGSESEIFFKSHGNRLCSK